MSDEYVPIHERPYYTEAYADGYKNGRNPKSGIGMSAYFYGRVETHPEEDRERIGIMNSGWLVGWFTGSSDWTKENPDPRIVVLDKQIPMKEIPSD